MLNFIKIKFIFKMENKKEYDLDKLKSFLSKVVNKLEEGTENVGKENEAIISNWLEDLGSNKLNINENNQLTISFNDSIYQENLKNANEPEDPLLNSFYDNLQILIDEKKSPHDKDEALNFISANIKLFNFSEKEEIFLINLLLEKEWEKINGAILIFSEIIDKNLQNVNLDKIIEALHNNFLFLIKQQEYRLRANLTILFKLCTKKLLSNKLKNFEFISKWIEQLFADIFWNFLNPNNSENLQHPTLETSKNILIEILSVIKFDFEKENDKNLHNNLFDSDLKKFTQILIENLSNENKGIRSSSYEILRNLIFLFDNDSNYDIEVEIFKKLSEGLVDFYPQIRYTASLFILEYTKYKSSKILLDNSFFFQRILPKICVNRYIPVEGVKNSSLEVWRSIVETNGIKIIKENFENYLTQYLKEMNSKSHLAREAGSRCLQEIVMKVYEEKSHRKIIENNHELILNSIEVCIKDPCWNVRESSLYAAGYVFNLIVESESREIFGENFQYLQRFEELITLHLFDNIYEVRAASALALRVIFSQNCKSFLQENHTAKYLKLLFGQLINSSQLNSAYEKFKTQLREKIENYQNIMLKNEKCCESENNLNLDSPHHCEKLMLPDLGFTREIEFWEYVDGIIHLHKEFCEDANTIKKLEMKLEMILMNVIDYLSRNFALLQNLSKKTIWIALQSGFEKIEKSEIDFYFEYVQNILFKELKENLNNASVFEAENFLILISKLKGKKYILNKLKSLKIDMELSGKIEKLLSN